jgi:NADP-dependent 3-hydroxy acid dehydrogenase YdfG
VSSSTGGLPAQIDSNIVFGHVTRDIILLHSVYDPPSHHRLSSLLNSPTMASTALIIGASQGLGASLVRHYAKQLSPSNVFATIRETAPKSDDLFPKGVNVIPNIDVSKKDCGDKVVDGLQGRAVDHVWIVAGLLKGEVSQSLYQLARISHLDFNA